MSDTHPLLAALDPEQRLVAEASRGAVVVLAGAGTGKTRAVTHRIAYGVQTGVYQPNQVMALTFTTRAAGEVRARLRGLGAGTIAVRTFHAAALAQLNHFWPRFVGGRPPRVVPGKAALIADAARRVGVTLDTGSLRDVASQIEFRKVTALGPDDFAAHVHALGGVGRCAPETVLSLNTEYERAKTEARFIDLEDVLLATLGLLREHPEAAAEVRAQYRSFVVDEFQDVSPVQFGLLTVWLGDRQDVCVVGDPSQTVYSFAGASSDYILDFARRFPDAVEVRLHRNYRSSAPIITLANAVVRGLPGAIALTPAAPRAASRPRAGSAAGPTAPAEPARPRPPTPGTAGPSGRAARSVRPALHAYPDERAEARGIAALLSERLAAGVSLDTCAVLVRANTQIAPLERACAEAGIPTRVRGAERFFELPEVRAAAQAIRAHAVAQPQATADPSSPATTPLFQAFEPVLRAVGWTASPPAGWGAARAQWDSLDAIARMVDEFPPHTTFPEFAAEFRARAEHQHEPSVAAITITTLHAAKGLEWDHVWLPGLSDGLLPISYAVTDAEIAEERRLLYVGITRARLRLWLSWAEVSAGQRRTRSRLLAGLDSHTRDGAAPPS